MGLKDRVARVEGELAFPTPGEAQGWTPEQMTEVVVDEISFGIATKSTVYLCALEVELLERELCKDGVTLEELEEAARVRPSLRTPVPASAGFVVKRYGGLPSEWEPWRERVRRHEERVEAFLEETKRRDAQLIAESRKACGLPLLEEGDGWPEPTSPPRPPSTTSSPTPASPSPSSSTGSGRRPAPCP